MVTIIRSSAGEINMHEWYLDHKCIEMIILQRNDS